ncbi:hypothetical protein ACLMJK_008487 [Lecanora helva]
MRFAASTVSALALLLSLGASAQQNLATCNSNGNCDFSLVCVKPYEDAPGTCEVSCITTSDEPCPLGNRCTVLPGFSTLEVGYCAEPAACGGFAGTSCTDDRNPACVDDPRDDCDPLKGDNDCSGICVVSPSLGTWDTNNKTGLSCDGTNGKACPAGFKCVENPKFLCDPTEQVCQGRCAVDERM